MTAKRYLLATYGCQMNEYDSRLIASSLEACGCEETKLPEQADVIVVNTCSIRENAESSAYQNIRRLAVHKKRNPALRIAVVGCMAQNHKERILTEMPHVDLVVGPDNYNGLENLLLNQSPNPKSKPTKAERRQQSKVIAKFDNLENYMGKSARSWTPYSSLVTIQRGCNKKCSYCIVPFVRGPEKCRETGDILREVRELADQGLREVTLLGQTVNSWKSGGDTFAALLMQVAEVPGIERVRFTSPHPRHFTPDLIWAVTHGPRICRHAHMPLQSGSDRILKKMRRQYSLAEFMGILEKLRAADPSFTVTTDLIAGFAGETDDDFELTMDAIKMSQFDGAFMFAYSPRSGTEAFAETETVTEAQKSERLQRMIDLQHSITKERTKLQIGKTESLLLEGPSFKNKDEWLGKTDGFRKVIVPMEPNFRPGALVDAELIGIKGWTLRGRSIPGTIR